MTPRFLYTLFIATFLVQFVLGQSIIDILSNRTELSSLLSILTQHASIFSGLQDFTLLAPNNDAFTKFFNSSASAGVGNQSNVLEAILSYHVLDGVVTNVSNTAFLPTRLQPSPQFSNVTGGQRIQAVVENEQTIYVSGLLQQSKVVEPGFAFDGGILYVVDQVLTIPVNVTATASAIGLSAAEGATVALSLGDMLDSMTDMTLFAPTNSAFQRVNGVFSGMSIESVTDGLEYHVIPSSVLYTTEVINGSVYPSLYKGFNLTMRVIDGELYVNNARILRPNVLTSNGVLHVIDRGLNPANATLVPVPSTTIDAYLNALPATGDPYTSDMPTPSYSPVPTTNTRFSNLASSPSSSASSSSHSNVGAIAGGVIGGVLALAVVVGLGLWFLKYKKNTAAKANRSKYNGRHQESELQNNQAKEPLSSWNEMDSNKPVWSRNHPELSQTSELEDHVRRTELE